MPRGTVGGGVGAGAMLRRGGRGLGREGVYDPLGDMCKTEAAQQP
jgi:hypothetical protein